MVDASNSLNHRAALLNMFHLCPPLATILTNTHHSASQMVHLYCHRKVPLAMPMYAISVVPVIQQLMGLAHQVWCADDVAAGGSLLQFRDWWSGLLSFAHHFSYHVNVAKIWLVVKEECLVSARL